MYAQHHYLAEVEPSAHLWRYMDLAKFVSILMHEALFLPSLGHLAQASDAFEGAFSAATYAPENLKAAGESIATELQGFEPPFSRPDAAETARTAMVELFSSARLYDQIGQESQQVYFASCWNESRYESAALWSAYIRVGEGIAIQTTAGRLRKSIDDAPGKQYIAHVEYKDFRTEVTPVDIRRVFWKRLSFDYEREVRVVVLDHNPAETYVTSGGAGIYVPCDVEALIENIYVAPTSAPYFREVVQSVASRYGLEREPK